MVNESDALWVVSTKDGSRELLVPAPEGSPTRRFDLAWSPNGKLIAYSVMEEVTNGDNMGIRRLAIDVVDLETKSARRLTWRPSTDGTAISWSSDSTRVAFLGLPDGSPEPSRCRSGTARHLVASGGCLHRQCGWHWRTQPDEHGDVRALPRVVSRWSFAGVRHVRGSSLPDRRS